MNEDRITGTAEELAGRTEAAFGDMTGNKEAEAGGRAREMGGKAQNLYGQARDAARDAAGAARDAAGAAAGYAKDLYDHRSEHLRTGSEALAQKVQDNPLGSIVTACAIGFGLALWLTRPPRRRRPRYYS